MGHVGVLTLKVDSRQTNVSAGELAATKRDVVLDYTLEFINGTGTGAANNSYIKTRSLASGATEDIDLAGVLSDIQGTVLTMTKVKGLIIRAARTNTTSITVSRPAANGVPIFAATSDAVAPLTAGGWFAWADPVGITVGAGTADLITITNSAGAAASYDIVIFCVA